MPPVRIIKKGTLRDYWRQHPEATQPLKSWYREVKAADWQTPHDVKDMFGSASVVGDNRVVFNIAGNKYRLVVKFNYPYRVAYIRFIGTHAEYDEIDVEEI